MRKVSILIHDEIAEILDSVPNRSEIIRIILYKAYQDGSLQKLIDFFKQFAEIPEEQSKRSKKKSKRQKKVSKRSKTKDDDYYDITELDEL